MTDGADSWSITSVTISNTVTLGGYPPQTLHGGEDREFLCVEMQCLTGKNLFRLVQDSAEGFGLIYVTDSEGDKHIALEIGVAGPPDTCESNWVLFEAIPTGRQGFRLYVADMPPIDLGL